MNLKGSRLNSGFERKSFIIKKTKKVRWHHWENYYRRIHHHLDDWGWRSLSQQSAGESKGILGEVASLSQDTHLSNTPRDNLERLISRTCAVWACGMKTRRGSATSKPRRPSGTQIRNFLPLRQHPFDYDTVSPGLLTETYFPTLTRAQSCCSYVAGWQEVAVATAMLL